MGGDCITTHLVPLSTGIDMIRATIEIACGDTPDISPKFEKGSAIRYFSVPNGTITAVEGVEDAKKMDGVREIAFVKGVGDTVGDIGSSTDRVGFVIAQAESAEQAVSVCRNVCECVRIRTEI